MKKLLVLALSFAAIGFTGCIKEKNNPVPHNGAIKITSTIDEHRTRAAIDNFEGDLSIGIYKLPGNESDFGAAHRANARYNHTSDGDFVPAAGHTLYWKEQAVDLVAYYPWEAGVESDHIYELDITDQIDFLYSDKVTGRTGGTVNFTFRHTLSKLIFEVADEDTSVSLANLGTEIDGLDTYGMFDLADPTGGFTTDEAGVIVATLIGDADELAYTNTAEAIVFPGQNLSYSVVFTLPGGVTTKPYTISGKNYDANKIYTYEFTIKSGGEDQVEVEMRGSSIAPWEDSGDPVDKIDVEKEEGAETPEPVIEEEDFVVPAEFDEPLPVNGGTFTIGYTVTNPIAGVEVEPAVSAGDESWITINPATRATEKSISLTVKSNTGAAREGSVALNYNGVTLRTVEISQEAASSSQTYVWTLTANSTNFGSTSSNTAGVNNNTFDGIDYSYEFVNGAGSGGTQFKTNGTNLTGNGQFWNTTSMGKIVSIEIIGLSNSGGTGSGCALVVYEGNAAKPSTTPIQPTSTNGENYTFTLSGENGYFQIGQPTKFGGTTILKTASNGSIKITYKK